MKRIYILVLLLAVFGNIESFSIGKYLIPCNEKLLSASQDSLLAQVGVRERTGRNDGIKVEQYLNSVGLSKGNPYCAAGQYWCFRSSCKDLKLTVSEIPIYRTGSTVKMFNEGMKIEIKQTPKPKCNDLIFWRRPNTWTGHVERIIEVFKAGWIRTVGFNTSSGVSGSQNDGEGVFIRKRNVNHFLGRMAVRGYLGFNPIDN